MSRAPIVRLGLSLLAIRSVPMMQRNTATPVDPGADDRLTFSDVTMLAFLAVAAVTLATLLLLGAVSAEHRIAAVLLRVLGVL